VNEEVFGKILRGRAINVSLQEAGEMVAKRVRLLAKYSQPGIPSDLREEFVGAIELTATCHQIGQNYADAAEQISLLSNISAAELLVSAHLWLESVQSQGAGSQFRDKFRKLHDDVLRVLVAAAKDPSRAGETMDDIIRKDLPGLSKVEMTLSLAQASMLGLRVKEWQQTFKILAALAQFGLIWRNILYAGIIETLGSQLERQASWEKFKKDLAEVPVEAMSIIPIVGDLIGKAKLIFDMVVHLLDKEKALEDEAADLVTKQLRAHEFVDLYVASILRWGEVAAVQGKGLTDMLLRTRKELAGKQNVPTVEAIQDRLTKNWEKRATQKS
jgi:hypothetical protein